MSSSNMMYNLWKRNKKYRMARTYYNPPIDPEDEPFPDTNDNTQDYHISEPYVHNITSVVGNVPHGLPLNTGYRLVGRNNHITFVVSPRPWHNDEITTTIPNPGQFTNRYLTHRQHNLITHATRELPHDYPENFFEHAQNPEIMHIYSTHDDENLPGFNKILPGYVHYMEHDPNRHGSLPMEPQRQPLRSFIIRGLANKAARIISGQHPGGINSSFSPARDYFEEHEDKIPKELIDDGTLMSYEDRPLGAIAITLDKMHHVYDALPHATRQAIEFPEFIHGMEEHVTDPHYKTILHLIHQGLRAAT